MPYPAEIALTLAVALLGGVVFMKLRAPAGALVGALIFSACMKVFTGIGAMPQAVKAGVQIVAGAFVGQSITRGDLRELKTMLKPTLIYLLCVNALIFFTGFVIYRFSALNLATALLSVLPGGVSDISIMSAELGADPMQTTILQLARYIFALLILPQVDAALCARRGEMERAGRGMESRTAARKNPRNAALTITVCAAAGLLGKASGFPAGALVFSLAATAVLSVRANRAYMPAPIKRAAQVLAGCALGATVTMADIQRFPDLALPVALVLLNCVLINFGVSYLLYRVSDLTYATCLFGSVPAGMSDMALVSLDVGGDAPKVMALQLVRYLWVLGVMPSVVRLLVAVCT